MSSVMTESDIDFVTIDQDDISNYNPENILPGSLELIAEIRQWLQPTAYNNEFGEYRKHLASHAPGTSAWITTDPTYREWNTGTQVGTLWLKGIPGSGKSVLASHLIHHLSCDRPDVPVLFFFFRQIIDANHEPHALLRDWLDQILIYSPPLQQQLKNYVESQRELGSLSMEDLWSDLRLALDSLPKGAYCVADALDEIDEGHESFLQALAELGEWKPEAVKVLITSRPTPSIETALRGSKILQRRLGESDVDKDIAIFVQQSLDSASIVGSDRQLILGAVPGRANGVFLFARFAIDAFLEPGADVAATLQCLPTSLNEMYTKLLKDHAARSDVPDDIQRLVLQWATNSTRPLRLLELADMLGGTRFSGNERNLKAMKNLIRAACGPLLEILADETVSVVHHSLTEYLRGTNRSQESIGYPIIEQGEANESLALLCLTYMRNIWDISREQDQVEVSSDHNKQTLIEESGKHRWIIEQRTKHPFLEYAATNWPSHVIKSEAFGQDQSRTTEAIREFLQYSERFQDWLRFKWPGGTEGVTPLHMAAKVGIKTYIRELLYFPDTAIDAQDEDGKTPLWWAASSGHASIVAHLVAKGANPDQDDRNGLKPLHVAAQNNDAAVVKVLLESGVRPLTEKTREYDSPYNFIKICGNAPRSVGHTALMYACRAGHLEAVDAFMPFIEDPEVANQALAWGIESSKSVVVQRILQHPNVNVNTKVQGVTQLYLACKRPNPDIIAALLSAGANPNILSSQSMDGVLMRIPGFDYQSLDRYSPLHRLCEFRDTNEDNITIVANLLVGAGAKIQQQDPSGLTPLHKAVHSTVLTRILLDAGANANATDHDGNTPLHNVSDFSVMRLLIELGGGDINKKGKNGMTPLLCVLWSSQDMDSIDTLLEYGADCSVVDSKMNGPLHYFLWNSSFSSHALILKKLVSSGADPNAKNIAGQAPLHILQDRKGVMGPAMDILLAAGARIDVRDKNGAPLLFRVFSDREKLHDAISYFVDRGVSLKVCDIKGRTMLHEAIKTLSKPSSSNSQSPGSFIDYFLALGLDPFAVDYHGNNLLHELALLSAHRSGDTNYQTGVWKHLISLGLDVVQSNNAGRTPLHIICSSRHPNLKIQEFVIQVTRNSVVGSVDLVDNAGLTPLHLAATTSEQSTVKLLVAGANPTSKSHEGLTPLHLAARSREPNIVGLILDALYAGPTHEFVQVGELLTHSGQDLRRGFWYRTTQSKVLDDINALDEAGWTPLSYACRSGRPESVALLLKAGANITIGKVFHACAQFESEQALWDHPRHKADIEQNCDAGGLTILDSSRPSRSHRDTNQNSEGPSLSTRTERIDDILEMLVSHPAGSQALEQESAWQHHILIERAYRTGNDYTAACLIPVLKKKFQPDVPDLDTFAKFHMHQFRSSALQSLTNADVRKVVNNEQIFMLLMLRRQYDLVKELCRSGADFFGDNKYQNNLFGILVCHGYDSLAKSILHIQNEASVSGCDQSVMPDIKDQHNPVSHNVRGYNQSENALMPYLLMAVRRDLPSLGVMKLLVEDCRANVDEPFIKNPTTQEVEDSALLSASKGEKWWHVALAMPYLIQNSANLKIRNSKGQTSLHIAINASNASNNGSPYGYDAAKLLIDAGAEIDAIDGNGRSCLNYAKGNMPLIQLLVNKGAKIRSDAFIAAIDAQSNEAIQLYLATGANPNSPLIRSIADTKSSGFRRGLVDTWGRFFRLVKTLVKYGADPFRTFLIDDGEKSAEEYASIIGEPNARRDVGGRDENSQMQQSLTEGTILHEIVKKSGLVGAVLEASSIDVNRRDKHGQTLLLAACVSANGPDSLMQDLGADEAHETQSILTYLLSLGADPRAHDSQGRNALHCMIQGAMAPLYRKPGMMKDSLPFMATKYPDLINQQDSMGRTPLHTAIEYAIRWLEPKPAQVLLDQGGADPLLVDNDGNTCLHILAQRLHHESLAVLAEDLVRRGCNINARNKRGETPIFWMFLEKCDPRRVPKGGNTEGDYIERIGFFESLGADIHARDACGRNLLHLVAKLEENPRYAKFDISNRFKRLLDKAVDPLAEDHNRHTPVDIAVAFWGQESVQVSYIKKTVSLLGGHYANVSQRT
ncbi:ankyrin repeat-containing domain protein [Xylaria cubensis]|nr:ankyrin repeat-containing domain protein [Xylaria cubensis]